jgi:hypothetical protein
MKRKPPSKYAPNRSLPASLQEDLIEKALEGDSIFQLRTNTKPLIKKTPVDSYVEQPHEEMFYPLRCWTNAAQERAVYDVLWDMCHEPKHSADLVEKLQRETYWKKRVVSKLTETYGLGWRYTVRSIYEGFKRRGAIDAIGAIEVLCIDGGDLRALFRRYGDPDALRALFYWANHHQEYHQYCIV